MSAMFGRAAARLSGHAALLLGWSPATFWQATPEELAAILALAAPPDNGAMDRRTLDSMMEHDRDG